VSDRRLNIAVIPAAGIGARMQADRAKQMMELAGVPLLVHTLRRFEACDAVHQVILVLQPNLTSDVLALMNMSAAQLRTRFGDFEDLRDETLWGGVWTQHFKVTPKGAASYKYIEVWVDKDGMPVQTKMVEKNDDSTTVRLTNVERNASIPMDQFKIDLDSKVKIVKG